MSVTYSSYLKLDQLLALQEPLSDGPEHDELLFIVIHQVYELWFKEMLHELDYLARLMRENDHPRAGHTFKRILTILKVLVAQIDILETMTPLEFLSFRDRLESGSGFQSHQFRELECMLGVKNPAALARYTPGSPARHAIERRMASPTLWDAFLDCITANGYPVPARSDLTAPIVPSTVVQEVLVRIYRGEPSLASLCERMVDLDEGIQEWRYRHVKMVQRTIGTRQGTGGSAGAEYLATTLHKAAFPDLWAIRTEL